jgi:hypothetical protein
MFIVLGIVLGFILAYICLKPKIKQTKELFEKEKGVNIPITVSCKEDYYLLQDDYVIYYVAKLMNYKTVPIKIGTQGQNKFRRKLQVGVKVSHDKYGIGEIIKCDDKYIIISFDGEEKQFQLDFCVKNRVLKII